MCVFFAKVYLPLPVSSVVRYVRPLSPKPDPWWDVFRSDRFVGQSSAETHSNPAHPTIDCSPHGTRFKCCSIVFVVEYLQPEYRVICAYLRVVCSYKNVLVMSTINAKSVIGFCFIVFKNKLIVETLWTSVLYSN